MDALASADHYRAHLWPVWEALPERGEFNPAKPTTDVALVASYADILRGRRLGYRRFVFIEHGIGQSYRGSRSRGDAYYAGGSDRADVGLFLVPNETCAAQWRSAYPAARVEVVGSPRLDGLPRRIPDGQTTVAISFHWSAKAVAPEAGNAWVDFRGVLPALAERFHLIGHSHPNAHWAARMARNYQRLGIEYVPAFDDVCRRADVYVTDGVSTLYEFASTDRPVVVLNAKAYRKNVDHGLRFWQAANVGIQVDEPDALADAIDETVKCIGFSSMRYVHGQWPDWDREHALDIVYQPRTGGAALAAAAVTDWLGRTFWVGERGLEWFVPQTSGRIIPQGGA